MTKTGHVSDWFERLFEPITVVTLLLFVATMLLYCATRDLVHDSELNAQRQLRAYVGVTLTTPVVADANRIVIAVDNFGQTPASDVRVFSSLEFTPFGKYLPAEFKFVEQNCADREPEAVSALVLFPKNATSSVRYSCQARNETVYMQRMQRNELFAFYFGHITYRDIFKAERRTNFCFRLTQVGGATLCDRHNEIDPDEKPH